MYPVHPALIKMIKQLTTFDSQRTQRTCITRRRVIECSTEATQVVQDWSFSIVILFRNLLWKTVECVLVEPGPDLEGQPPSRCIVGRFHWVLLGAGRWPPTLTLHALELSACSKEVSLSPQRELLGVCR